MREIQELQLYNEESKGADLEIDSLWRMTMTYISFIEKTEIIEKNCKETSNSIN